ncbi:MAG: hypothetical protein ACHRHE_10065 [Tepidisphaerales bacterium]
MSRRRFIFRLRRRLASNVAIVVMSLAFILLYLLSRAAVSASSLAGPVSGKGLVSRLYDVRPQLMQAEAFERYAGSLHPDTRAARFVRREGAGANRGRGSGRGFSGGGGFGGLGAIVSSQIRDVDPDAERDENLVAILLDLLDRDLPCSVGPIVEGRVCVIADETSHRRISRVLEVLARPPQNVEELPP